MQQTQGRVPNLAFGPAAQGDPPRAPENAAYDYETHKRLVTETLNRNRTGYRIAKRIFDVAFSLCALICLSPLFLALAAVIFIDDPHGNPFFSQDRVGLNGRVFRFRKFRSMYVDAQAHVQGLLAHNTFSGPVFKMKDDPRITRIGRLIRKTSLDELPQFWNVLVGDMSLVGPRPPVCWEAERYSPYQRLRLLTKPGLTCYWQVAPRKYEMRFDDYVALDLRYMREQSFWVDLMLVLKTVRVMCSRENE